MQSVLSRGFLQKTGARPLEKEKPAPVFFTGCLDLLDVYSAQLGAVLGIGLGLEGDLLALFQSLKAVSHDSGEMHKHVVAALVVRNEAITLFCVKLFDCTVHHSAPPEIRSYHASRAGCQEPLALKRLRASPKKETPGLKKLTACVNHSDRQMTYTGCEFIFGAIRIQLQSIIQNSLCQPFFEKSFRQHSQGPPCFSGAGRKILPAAPLSPPPGL